MTLTPGYGTIILHGLNSLREHFRMFFSVTIHIGDVNVKSNDNNINNDTNDNNFNDVNDVSKLRFRSNSA